MLVAPLAAALGARLIAGPRDDRAPVAPSWLALASRGAWFPPAPTFTGAFAGGVVATNAAGAATFRHGPIRPWVEALTIVRDWQGTRIPEALEQRVARSRGPVQVHQDIRLRLLRAL